MKFLIKPFSEIMIKSKPVRKRYLNRLQTNIQFWVKEIESKLKTHVFYDKLELNYTWELDEFKLTRVRTTLSRTPWIESFLEVQAFLLPEKNDEIFDFVFERAKDFYLDKIEWKTFVVRVKRSWTHNFTSIDLERYVWWWLLKFSKNAKVKVKDPEITVNIEIKDWDLFIVKDKFSWIWWYPVWTQDKVLSLISWGFDSWVSTFSMMKRWCKVDFLFFNLGWTAHELWVKQVASYLNKNFSAWYNARFITIPFEEVVAELLTTIESKFRAIILKRLFLMVADKLASEHEYYAIVKWDSLWQVSSQTLKNMFVIDKASTTLVLRPLIAFNKQEIVNVTKQIWTYDFACNMPEYCWVVSDKPATWARLDKVILEEQKFSLTLLDKAIENKKVEDVSNMLKDINDSWTIDISYVPWENEVVIDIREVDKIEKEPLLLDNIEILKIPFFEINHKFAKLDNTKVYLLYCDKWVLSNLHWLYLKEKWFDNVKVYRPVEKWCKLK